MAAEHGPTRAAIVGRLRWALLDVPLGIALVTASGLHTGPAYPGEENLEALGLLVGVAGFALVVYGLGSLPILGAYWLHLRRHPWRVYECRFRDTGATFAFHGTPVLVLYEEGTEEGRPLVIESLAHRWHALEACDGGQVWFAGRAGRSGVVAPPGGTHLLRARRVRWKRNRDRLLRIATAPR
jgi:hypothetical protein